MSNNQSNLTQRLDALRKAGLLREQVLGADGWAAAASGETLTVTNPATGEAIAQVPNVGEAETAAAIDAAQAAQTAWAARTGKQRAIILRAWFDLIVAHADDLALLITSEQGKPLAEAKGEVMYAASFIEWFAEEAKRVSGDVLAHPETDKRITVLRQPVGVCAAITPWNFPAAMITRKAGPALAAGCAMIVRPADQTPLTALALGELALRAGVPQGVLQVITGRSRVIGPVLTGSPVVRKLSFTGSTEVGRVLMAQSAETIKRLSLELGGNAPFIVFDDADLEAAVEGAIASKYRNSGQTCVCSNRFLVQDGIYDRFVTRLAERVQELKVGDGLAAGTQIGPLIDDKAFERVGGLVRDAVAQGASVVTGGKPHALGGRFFEPTVLRDVTADMRVSTEEIFGPLAPVVRFSTEAEAIQLANDTEFGLASYFYTESNSRIWRVGEALEYGMVGVNTGLISNEVAPFGGVKQSGLGREGSYLGIDEYLEVKYLCVKV